MNEQEKKDFIRSFAHMRGKEGLPEPPRPSSKPTARKPEGILRDLVDSSECPVCGCEEIMEVEMSVEHEELRGGQGHAVFLGCPACPWASEMLTVATTGAEVD
jgi:hypothetical protein